MEANKQGREGAKEDSIDLKLGFREVMIAEENAVAWMTN